MRRIAIAVMSTISGLVLLFSYHTSTGQSGTAGTIGATGSGSGSGITDPDSAGPSGPAGDDSAGDDSAGDATNSPGSGSSGAASGSSSSGSTSVTGDSVQTRWGPVQVRITVKNGKIVTSEAIVYPNNNHHDVRVNSYAVPILNQQAVEAQSADIDGVSGATVTSAGYEQSLQSAIDKAHLG